MSLYCETSFLQELAALITRTRQKRHILHYFAKITHFYPLLLISLSNNHTLDIDTLFPATIQCLGHTDGYKMVVEKLPTDSKLQANSPTYKLSGST